MPRSSGPRSNGWGLLGRPVRSYGLPPSEFSGIHELQLIDVALVASTDQGLVEVPGLELRFDRAGMTVRKRSGETVRVIPWPTLRQIVARHEHPAGHLIVERIGLEVQSDRRRHRFVVDNVDPRALTGLLGAISSRFAGYDMTADERDQGLHHHRG
jgi:hypothetical protein